MLSDIAGLIRTNIRLSAFTKWKISKWIEQTTAIDHDLVLG